MSDTPRPANPSKSDWSTLQISVLAVLCFALGLASGYLFHGSSTAPESAQPPATAAASQGIPPGMSGSQVTPEQLRHMADKTAEPVLAALKVKPNDPALLSQAGNVYYDAQQYSEAVKFYADSLKADPGNPNVRTDMATAYYYMGDADRALGELNTALTYDPKHSQTLLNIGLIKWQAKMDINGAVAAWQKLLDTNPSFEQADQVRQMITQAKQHAGIKPGTKAQKPL